MHLNDLVKELLFGASYPGRYLYKVYSAFGSFRRNVIIT